MKYQATFQTYINLVVEVDADNDDQAAERAWDKAEEYLRTVGGNYRDVRAEATLDGVGADEVTAATP